MQVFFSFDLTESNHTIHSFVDAVKVQKELLKWSELNKQSFLSKNYAL